MIKFCHLIESSVTILYVGAAGAVTARPELYPGIDDLAVITCEAKKEYGIMN